MATTYRPPIFDNIHRQDQLAQFMNVMAGEQNMARQAELRSQVPQQRAYADMFNYAKGIGYDSPTAMQMGEQRRGQDREYDLKERALAGSESANEGRNLADLVAALGGGGGGGMGMGMGMGGAGGGGAADMINALISREYPGLNIKPPRDKQAELAELLKNAPAEPDKQPSVPWQNGAPPIGDTVATMFGGGEYGKANVGQQQGPVYGPPAPQPAPAPYRPPQLGDDPAQAFSQMGRDIGNAGQAVGNFLASPPPDWMNQQLGQTQLPPAPNIPMDQIMAFIQELLGSVNTTPYAKQ